MKFCQHCGCELHDTDTECPQCHTKIEETNSIRTSYYSEGSYGAGWLLGFFLGILGLIIALCIDKSETKRGAVTGFVISLIIGIVLGIIIGCAEFSMITSMM